MTEQSTEQSSSVNNDHHNNNDHHSDPSSSSEEEEEISTTTTTTTTTTPSSSSTNSFSQRLFSLQLRLNQAKQENLEQVKQEQEQLDYKKKVFYKHKNVQEKEMLVTNVTLSESNEFEKKRQRSQKTHAQGWESLNSDALYKSHKKRIKRTISDKAIEEYKLGGATATTTTDNDGGGANDSMLSYGSKKSSFISEENKQAMADEFKKDSGKSSSKKKNNGDNDDDGDGSMNLYVNNTNKVFTKSLSKAYDKYTKDIRSNLERGTAL